MFFLNISFKIPAGIVQDHLRITAIRIIVGIPITEMTIETIVVNIVVAEILTEILIAEITITTVGIVAEDAGEGVAVGEAAVIIIAVTTMDAVITTTTEEADEIMMTKIDMTETAKKINFPIIWSIFLRKMIRLPPEPCSRATWS